MSHPNTKKGIKYDDKILKNMSNVAAAKYYGVAHSTIAYIKARRNISSFIDILQEDKERRIINYIVKCDNKHIGPNEIKRVLKIYRLWSLDINMELIHEVCKKHGVSVPRR